MVHEVNICCKNTTTIEYRYCWCLMEDEQCFYFFANVVWFHQQRTILLFSYWFQKTLKLVVFVKVDFQSKSDWNPFVLRSVGKTNTQLPYRRKKLKIKLPVTIFNKSSCILYIRSLRKKKQIELHKEHNDHRYIFHS